MLGSKPVTEIKARLVTERLGGVRARGNRTRESSMPAPQTLKNILYDVSVVLDDLWRKEAVTENAAKGAQLPKRQRRVTKREVLTNVELAGYLAWQHPHKERRLAVLERLTIACVSRLFGGVRTGDLRAMR